MASHIGLAFMQFFRICSRFCANIFIFIEAQHDSHVCAWLHHPHCLDNNNFVTSKSKSHIQSDKSSLNLWVNICVKWRRETPSENDKQAKNSRKKNISFEFEIRAWYVDSNEFQMRSTQNPVRSKWKITSEKF